MSSDNFKKSIFQDIDRSCLAIENAQRFHKENDTELEGIQSYHFEHDEELGGRCHLRILNQHTFFQTTMIFTQDQ